MQEDMTAQAQAKAKADYDELIGKVILVGTIDGYMNEIDQVVIDLDPPAVMRIVPYDDVSRPSHVDGRWMDDVLDPVYDVELLEPHPQLEGVRSMWIYGRSWTEKAEPTGSIDHTVAPDDLQEAHAPVVDTTSPWFKG
jgi:hypothetical protein